ncbi:MAG: CinA family protein [Actinomycetaceae bacterium]|nr:CinA family protein [Actinomycetaceae bacterium]
MIEQEVVARLQAAGLSIATAESLTGGALCARLVDIPGASLVVRGGVCTYATDLKRSMLNVDTHLLVQVGPVHRDVAIAMARGAHKLFCADIAVATTGVAGPGPADGHPAGTAHIAVFLDATHLGSEPTPPIELHRELHIEGNRDEVRRKVADSALELVIDALNRRHPRH